MTSSHQTWDGKLMLFRHTFKSGTELADVGFVANVDVGVVGVVVADSCCSSYRTYCLYVI